MSPVNPSDLSFIQVATIARFQLHKLRVEPQLPNTVSETTFKDIDYGVFHAAMVD